MWSPISLLAQAPTNCDSGCDIALPQIAANDVTVGIVAQIAFGIIAIVTVIFIILSGFQLITSQGDPQAIAKARQSILFAVGGLIIALAAELIVTFTLGNL